LCERQVLYHLGRHILEHVRQLPCQLQLAGGEQRAERLYMQPRLEWPQRRSLYELCGGNIQELIR